VIAALLIDLGDTLVQGEQVLPHAPEALACLASVPVEHGGTLPLALVSDFDDALSEYVALVDKLGLLRYFDPPERHVTISALEGVRKPARKIFELAMTRLGLGPDLARAAFITENAGHISACRALGMKALQFGVDFQDWADVPLRVLAWTTPSTTVIAGAV